MGDNPPSDAPLFFTSTGEEKSPSGGEDVTKLSCRFLVDCVLDYRDGSVEEERKSVDFSE